MTQVIEQEGWSPQKLCESVYAHCSNDIGWSVKDFLGGREFRYFSYGRRALVEALRVAGVRQGDTVLLPGLICRDIFSSLAAAGAAAKFYPVASDLHLAASPADLPQAKAVIAVNYFGFPQDLTPFQKYCRRTGAILVEDNAHGLFSQDEHGRYLGTRGDLGIFSLRKTITLPNGAMLVVNEPEREFALNPQEAFDVRAEPLSFRVKQATRRLVAVLGHKPVYRLVVCVRRWRQFKARRYKDTAGAQTESILPLPENPSRVLSGSIKSRSPQVESTRRRTLYRLVDRLINDTGKDVRPVFSTLPENVVPYSYPFYAALSEIEGIDASLEQLGLFCHPWPDLPEAIQRTAPVHYKTLWNVPFLW